MGGRRDRVFAVFPDGELWDRYWDGTSWHDWESLGGNLSGDPAVSSSGADRIDVWAPGRDGRVWHRWWDGTRWVEWEQLGTMSDQEIRLGALCWNQYTDWPALLEAGRRADRLDPTASGRGTTFTRSSAAPTGRSSRAGC